MVWAAGRHACLSLHSIPTAGSCHGSVRRPQAENLECAVVWTRACSGQAGDFAAQRILDQLGHSLAPRFYTAFRVRGPACYQPGFCPLRPEASRDTGNGSGLPGNADESQGLGYGDHHAQKEALQVTTADRAALRRLVDSLACTRVVITHGLDTLVRHIWPSVLALAHLHR